MLQKYRSHKEIWAEPMDRKTAELKGLVRDKKPKNEDGYRVKYRDGYESWSPKKAFEDGYTLVLESGTDVDNGIGLP